MLLQKEYYIHKLYPLQDFIFQIVSCTNTDFYLTGGTALGRFHLMHRFSDDLDFFVNDQSNFSEQIDEILNRLKEEKKITVEIAKRADDFTSVFCSQKEIKLKIDFVNDIPYHSGGIEKKELFPRVDSWWNILSNKICALERREAKDVADILFICRKYPFAWDAVFKEARQKTSYIDPLDISVVLAEFPKEFFNRIKWIDEISIDDAFSDCQKISKDILQREDNMLAV